MLEFIFNSFVTLLVVVDPLGLAPIFAALTRGYSEKRKQEAAIRGTVLGGLILLLFALVGDALLGALGIGLAAFRTAGGILLFLLALDMIFARPSGLRSRSVRDQEEESHEQDVSVFPLAIPLIAGPGAITTVLLYTSGSDISGTTVFIAVLLVVLLLSLGALLLAPASCGCSARRARTSSPASSPSSSSSTASSRFSTRTAVPRARVYTLSMTHGPIVLVGGMTSLPRRYDALARTLRELSGSEVYVAPLTPLDWLLGHIRGYGQLVFEVATAVDRALLKSEANKVVLVGHSAGGLACRIFIGGDAPYGGRRYSGHRRVSRLITLGTPHLTAQNRGPSLVAQVNELFPGAPHAANIGYLSVAGAAADGATSPRTRKRYERLVEDGRLPGDGVVPVESALLPGSEQLILDDLYHNHHLGRWYGSDKATVMRWWPRELHARTTNLVEEHRGT